MTIENFNNCCGDCSQCECNGVHVQNNFPSKKHANLIKSWLSGVPIQIKSETGEWVDIDNPTFSEHNEYRVKPKNTKKKVGICFQNGCIVVSTSFVNCELEFEDGELIGAKPIPVEETVDEDEKSSIYYKPKPKRRIFDEMEFPKFNDYWLNHKFMC